MAINPVLALDQFSNSYFPLPAGNETYLLHREGIDFRIKTPTWTYSGTGGRP